MTTKNCRTQYCNIIKIEPFTAGDWYVGIISTGNKQRKFYIWADELCANRCNGQGVCIQQYGPLQGMCDCETKWKGFDCSSTVGTISSNVVILLIVLSLNIVLAVIAAFLFIRNQLLKVRYVKL